MLIKIIFVAIVIMNCIYICICDMKEIAIYIKVNTTEKLLLVIKYTIKSRCPWLFAGGGGEGGEQIR